MAFCQKWRMRRAAVLRHIQVSFPGHGHTLSGSLNALFWSLMLVGGLLLDCDPAASRLDLTLDASYLLLSIFVLNVIAFFVLKAVLKKLRFRGLYARVLAHVGVAFLFLSNALVVRIYGRQLGLMGLVMAVRGWRSGDLGTSSHTAVLVALVLAVYAGCFSVMHFILFRLTGRRRIPRRMFVKAVACMGVAAGVLHGLLLARVAQPGARDFRNRIPWQAITGFPKNSAIDAAGGVAPSPFPKLFADPPILESQTELGQIKDLEEVRTRILARPVVARRPLNILILGVEGLRHDMLAPDKMPSLYGFARRRGLILEKHYATGNNTPSGTFGLMTGCNPFYFDPMRQVGGRNLALEVLKKAGYQQSVYYNSDKNYEHLYSDLFERTEGKFCASPSTAPGDYARRDKQLTSMYLNELERDPGRPRFDFLMLYSTHYNYYYPEAFAARKPDGEPRLPLYSGPRKRLLPWRTELFNRYLNAVGYVDSLLGTLLKRLEDTGRLNQTIVAIVGDHGEEFWERGSYGHSQGLNNYQIQPAAVLFFPGMRPGCVKYRYSSHADLLPTIFQIVGLNVDGRAFMSGKSLLDYDPDQDFALAGQGIVQGFRRNEFVIVGLGYKIIFRNDASLNDAPLAMFDDEDRPIPNPDYGRARKLLLRIAAGKNLLHALPRAKP